MKIRFQGDYDLKRAIISGVKRRQSEIDFQNADDANLRGMDDQDVLAVAAREGRILVSHDHSTMPVHCRIETVGELRGNDIVGDGLARADDAVAQLQHEIASVNPVRLVD